jgi:protein gp37
VSAVSAIEWTDRTWNPVRGCSIVSPGCVNCYAMKQAHRFSGRRLVAGSAIAGYVDGPYTGLTKRTSAGPQWTGIVRTVESALLEPLSWRKPARVFVNSMSDLFHEDVPDAFIDRVFAVMALAPWHTFQALTKRAERMRDYFSPRGDYTAEWYRRVFAIVRRWKDEGVWTMPKGDRQQYMLGEAHASLTAGAHESRFLPNVWLGVSCENQEQADKRIPLLLQTPAAVRWVSAEPLLSALDIRDHLTGDSTGHETGGPAGWQSGVALDWVVVGGESGPGARPFDVAWARSIVQQCKAADVPVFVKQLGAAPLDSSMSETRCRGKVHYRQPAGSARDVEHREQIARGAAPAYTVEPMRVDLRDRKGGDPSEWPEDLRVREYPRVEVTHG